MKEIATRKEDNWWKDISYEDAKTYIKTNVQTMTKSFIAVGYYLKQIRDRELFREDGYKSVWEFASETYGMSRTTASRWMEMNDRFSKDGNSPLLAERYREFGKSQLQEMLYLPEEALEDVNAEMTVKQIRSLRNPEERREEAETEADILPPCIMGKAENGICEAAAYCIDGRECCAGCGDEDCVIRCKHVEAPQKPSEKERNRSESNQDGGEPVRQQAEGGHEIQHEELEPKAAEEPTRHAPGTPSCAAEPQDAQGECATSHTEKDIVDLHEGEWKEQEGTDRRQKLTPGKVLKKERHVLENMTKALADMKMEKWPDAFTKQEILVEALELLVEKQKGAAEREAAAGQEEHLQPELPHMKNNDQRKAWLKGYQNWGLWYEDKNLGVKYYKYDFENGARLIVEEYKSNTYCGDEYELPYFHLVGGPEPPKGKYGYGKWNRHERYHKHPDSETELVEFLKFAQRGK